MASEKKGINKSQKLENISAFIIVILLSALFVAIQEQLVFDAYEGDAIITESEVTFITNNSVKYLSSEKPIRLFDLFVIPYVQTVENNGSNVQIRIETTDFTGLYEQVEVYPALRLHDNTFDFGRYYTDVLEPAIVGALNETNNPELSKQTLEQQFAYHRFAFNEQ